MGREVRRVPPGWFPPKKRYLSGEDYHPQYDEAYEVAIEEWVAGREEWKTNPKSDCSYEDWYGSAPDPAYYRPNWTEEERTHFQYYSTVSEGSPLSPAFPTIEELAKYLAEHREFNADKHPSIFPIRTYEEWVRVLSAGWSPSLVISEAGIEDGATYLDRTTRKA